MKVHFYMLLLALSCFAGCRSQSDSKSTASSPEKPAAEKKTSQATTADKPSSGTNRKQEESSPDNQKKECLPVEKQTGTGCDMQGIMAAIGPLRKPGGEIPACYLAHVRPPSRGKLMLRFSLTPEGRAQGWQWARDDFDNPALRECLEKALAALSFPAPGDKPCQVVYPFTFVPEVKRDRP